MELLTALITFAIISTITPGPNNIMIMTSGMNFGIRRSFPHYLGICIGFPGMIVMVGLGLGVIFELVPVLHDVIKIVGIVYLLYLAWLIANSASDSLEENQAKPISFFQAALFQWVNPKAWIMATGAVAAYTSASGDILVQVLVIALVFFLASFPCVGSWFFFGITLKRILKTPERQRFFNRVMSALLVCSILPASYEIFVRYLT